MLRFIVRRGLLSLLILFLAVSLMFGMIHMVPGDPATVMLGPKATPEMKAEFSRRLGLDQPLAVQLGRFYAGLARGDLGEDPFTNREVTVIVWEQLPYTLVLVLVAIGGASLLGIPLGCFSAIRRNSLLDRLTAVMSVAFIAIPSFVVALYLLLWLAVKWRWFPAMGAGESGNLADQAHHLVLPAIALGLGWVGYIARMVRASMLEVMEENHIRTARAFGLPERTVIVHYALRIAMLPTVTILGMGIGTMLSGALFAEIVFSRPGIGKLLYEAVLTRNYPIVMGSVLVTTGFFVLSTLASDIINAMLDPRLRERQGSGE
ncbi:MAG: ABC transporter permease [Xanthomonadales bacterium]|jgi:peptide/nickel transport system permease protein|nr:ABC transporter permease [Xanthomonadales bacterium]MDH3940175.1 ABC transporter permease [Xanthomonadales bacterium]MDH4002696.1 ABC transporter permease [Xanthomonadales bacterium]